MNDDEVERSMPNICMLALSSGHDPLSVTKWTLCVGFDVDTAAKIRSAAHKWLYAHRREYPWHIDKPDNDKVDYLQASTPT